MRHRLSFRRHSPYHRKTEQMYKVFWPNFLGRKTPIFLHQIASAIYCPPFAKVWSSSICWSLPAKPGNELQSRIYGGWVKTLGLILTHLWITVHEICRRCMRPFEPLSTLVRLSTVYHVSFTEQIYKVFGPQFFLDGMTPTFLWRIVSAIYCPPFGKVCWGWSGWLASTVAREVTLKDTHVPFLCWRPCWVLYRSYLSVLLLY